MYYNDLNSKNKMQQEPQEAEKNQAPVQNNNTQGPQYEKYDDPSNKNVKDNTDELRDVINNLQGDDFL